MSAHMESVAVAIPRLLRDYYAGHAAVLVVVHTDDTLPGIWFLQCHWPDMEDAPCWEAVRPEDPEDTAWTGGIQQFARDFDDYFEPWEHPEQFVRVECLNHWWVTRSEEDWLTELARAVHASTDPTGALDDLVRRAFA